MRDKKVKRKNKQKEDRFIQLKKQIDEYNYKIIHPINDRDYLNGYFSFFKNKEEYLDYGEFCVTSLTPLSSYEHESYITELVIDIHFLNLKCSDIIYKYIIDYHNAHFPRVRVDIKDVRIKAILAINLLQAANPNYTLPKTSCKL